MRGVTDYRMAKRALVRQVTHGAVRVADVCDAHPELLRAARNIGTPTDRPCPICDLADDRADVPRDESATLRLDTDVYVDDLHEEIVNGFEFIAASAKGAASRQKALHKWSSELADSVTADLERLKVAEPPVEGDLLAPPPFGDVEVRDRGQVARDCARHGGVSLAASMVAHAASCSPGGEDRAGAARVCQREPAHC
jgi:hypothetical protein